MGDTKFSMAPEKALNFENGPAAESLRIHGVHLYPNWAISYSWYFAPIFLFFLGEVRILVFVMVLQPVEWCHYLLFCMHSSVPPKVMYTNTRIFQLLFPISFETERMPLWQKD